MKSIEMTMELLNIVRDSKYDIHLVPSIKNGDITYYYKGQKIKIIEQAQEPFKDGDWIKCTPEDGSSCIIGQVDSIAEERVALWMSKSWYLKSQCSKLTDEQIKFLELEIMKCTE